MRYKNRWELACRETRGRHPACRIEAKKILLPKLWWTFFWKEQAGVRCCVYRENQDRKVREFLRNVGVGPQIKTQKHCVVDPDINFWEFSKTRTA